MDLNEYQEEARKTAIYPAQYAVTYPVLGLVNEAGEVAGKWKKVMRDGNGELSTERAYEIVMELGDVLWYLAQTVSDLGYSLEDVAEFNLTKLQSRQERGTLKGSGDNR